MTATDHVPPLKVLPLPGSNEWTITVVNLKGVEADLKFEGSVTVMPNGQMHVRDVRGVFIAFFAADCWRYARRKVSDE